MKDLRKLIEANGKIQKELEALIAKADPEGEIEKGGLYADVKEWVGGIGDRMFTTDQLLEAIGAIYADRVCVVRILKEMGFKSCVYRVPYSLKTVRGWGRK